MNSNSFFTNFRRENSISSRKINRVTGNAALKREEEIACDAAAFLLHINDKIADSCIWSADQSGFEYEPVRNPSLAFKEEKIVEATVADSNAVSHSYTLQLHPSKAGELSSHLFIRLQEKIGSNFGPHVQEKIDDVLRSCPNLRFACTKSGKFTTQIMQQWFNEVFLTDIKEQSMLTTDAWAGQGPTAGLSSPNSTLEYIPKGATKYIQPLDVYFFRQHKIWWRIL